VKNSPTITFLGATGTVTGSKYLLETAGTRVLVDCGLFQGEKSLRQRNWQTLPIDATSLDAVLLTPGNRFTGTRSPGRLRPSSGRGRALRRAQRLLETSPCVAFVHARGSRSINDHADANPF